MKVGDFITCDCGQCTWLSRITAFEDGTYTTVARDGEEFDYTDLSVVRKVTLTPAQQLAWSLGVDLKVSDLCQ